MGIKGTADLRRHFNAPLCAAAGNQTWVDPGKNLIERQSHQHAVAVVLSRENPGRGVAQFSERKFYDATSELRKNFFQGHSNNSLAHFRVKNSRLQFQWQSGQNSLERKLNAFSGALYTIGLIGLRSSPVDRTGRLAKLRS